MSQFGKKARSRLTKEQIRVCFNGGTEPAFTGSYWNNKQPGTYSCVVCSTLLFDSQQKYDSGTGWPSFYGVAKQSPGVITNRDESYGMVRTGVKCGTCSSHLGHVFEDGPHPSGLRYCINSASLVFTPRSQ